MITIQVKLFATLRRYYADVKIGEAMAVEMPEGATVGQLIERLRLPPDEVKVIFINNIVRQKGHPLADGDEMGIFPAVGGG